MVYLMPFHKVCVDDSDGLLHGLVGCLVAYKMLVLGLLDGFFKCRQGQVGMAGMFHQVNDGGKEFQVIAVPYACLLVGLDDLPGFFHRL